AFELQLDERRLLSDGAAVSLRPRAFDLLAAMAQRPGRLVTKNQLFELVWPKMVVEEAALHVQISALRKVLGTEAIATVSGHGYRFMLPVTAAEPSWAGNAESPQTLTFLFTDIEGSTQLWDTRPDAMRLATERHNAILRGAIAAHCGYA